MSTVITVENLGKKYTLHHQQREQYIALRDVISNGVRNLSKKIFSPFPHSSLLTDSQEDFWALKDVSFEVKQGERIGIIGRNGAGKSTLLKILSRITEPTTGSVRIKGRVASLLEVGTGFHPELTGRENIFLNGAILGMGRAEIKKKFDEIVDFAEIEKFLDTPVKRYSSGMYVRLAFAVAAHLEPEILIVDEVLAVGDAQFQKKCLGKMEDVSAKEGRTVLFVSHNMAAITRLCGKVISMNGGVLRKVGDAVDVVREYLLDFNNNFNVHLPERKDRQGTGIARFSSVELLDSKQRRTENVMCGQNMKICIVLSSQINELILANPIIALGVDDSTGQRVWHLSNESTGQYVSGFNIEKDRFEIEIPRLPLVPGTYSLVLFLSSNGTIIDWIQNVASFNVEPGDFHGTGKLPPPGQGFFLADYSVDVKVRHA
jgi:lipopolysaccharide transport system ATP-binding protein